MRSDYLLWAVTYAYYVKRRLTATKNLQYYITFVTHGYILNFLDFQRISSNNSALWLFFKCTSKKFPYGNHSNQNFHSFIHSNSEINESSVGKCKNDNSILTLNPPANLKYLFNQFNKLTAESNKKNPENFINCRNLNIDEIQKRKTEPN